MSIREMQHLQKFLTTELSLGSETQKVLEVSETSLKTISDIVANPNKTYSGLSGKLTKQLQVCISFTTNPLQSVSSATSFISECSGTVDSAEETVL